MATFAGSRLLASLLTLSPPSLLPCLSCSLSLSGPASTSVLPPTPHVQVLPAGSGPSLLVMDSLGFNSSDSGGSIAQGGPDFAHGRRVLTAYALLLVVTAMIGFWLRDAGPRVRWAAGFGCAGILGALLFVMVLPVLVPSGQVAHKAMLLAVLALWQCSNASLVFGGRRLLASFGVATWQRALLYGITPCQLRFVTQKHVVAGRTQRRCTHVACYLLAGLGLLEMLQSPALLSIISSYVVLEIEAAALLASFFVVALDALPLLWQLCFDALHASTGAAAFCALVVFPYGSIYCSFSSRDFWSRMSRPAGQLIRLMVYAPLGGARQQWLSVPLMFLFNGAAHFDVSDALLGRREEAGWITVYAILGAAATFEVLVERTLRGASDCEGMVPLLSVPRWWLHLRAVIAHLSLRAALFVVMRSCLHTDLAALLS